VRFFCILYFVFGVITGSRLVGRGVWPLQSAAVLVGVNLSLLALLVIGFVRANRYQRFAGMDKWIWLLAAFGTFAAGAIGGAVTLSR
jgi:hypothetical protein